MITTAQATQYLSEVLGMSAPSFIVSAACEKVEGAEPAMIAAGYSDMDQIMIQSMAVAIIASAGVARRIASQGAPSGASRSFKNEDGALSQLRRALASLDTAKTVAAIVGPDPKAGTMFMVC